MKYDPFSRRMFLQGLGGTLLPIPFLQSLMPRSAWAAETLPIKRYIALIGSYDYGHHGAWFPKGEDNLNNIPQPRQTLSTSGDSGFVRYQALTEFIQSSSDPLNRVFGNLLNPYLDQMNIIRSLDFIMRYGHGAAHTLGGTKGGSTKDEKNDHFASQIETIDQVLSQSSKFNPGGKEALFFGNSKDTLGEAYSYTKNPDGSIGYSTFQDDGLRKVYNSIFNEGEFPESGVTPKPHPRADILTKVLGDYNRVKNSRYISSLDRTVLSNATDVISDVIKGFATVAPEGCLHKHLDLSGKYNSYYTDKRVGEAFANLMVAAMMCDVTRTITMGMGMDHNSLNGDGFGHDDSHTPYSQVNGKENWKELADRQATGVRNIVHPLVERMSAAIDPSNGKSLLYNSLVHYSLESSLFHGYASHPCLLIGNAGGSMSTGHYLDYATRSGSSFRATDGFKGTQGNAQFSNNWHGVQYNRLLVTILQSMGLGVADYEKSNLNSQLEGRSDIGLNNMNATKIGGFGYAARKVLADMSTGDQGRLLASLSNYNLNHFKYPLAMPPTRHP